MPKKKRLLQLAAMRVVEQALSNSPVTVMNGSRCLSVGAAELLARFPFTDCRLILYCLFTT